MSWPWDREIIQVGHIDSNEVFKSKDFSLAGHRIQTHKAEAFDMLFLNWGWSLHGKTCEQLSELKGVHSGWHWARKQDIRSILARAWVLLFPRLSMELAFSQIFLTRTQLDWYLHFSLVIFWAENRTTLGWPSDRQYCKSIHGGCPKPLSLWSFVIQQLKTGHLIGNNNHFISLFQGHVWNNFMIFMSLHETLKCSML